MALKPGKSRSTQIQGSDHKRDTSDYKEVGEYAYLNDGERDAYSDKKQACQGKAAAIARLLRIAAE